MSNQKAQEEYLRETKRLMRSKLEEHGVPVTDSTPFRAYVDGIDQAVNNATPPPVGTDEEVDRLSKVVRLMVSGETTDSLELTSADFAGVDVVRRYALYGNLNLTSVEIHPDVLTIDPNAFNGCTKLETVRLPQKVKLQANCFANCSGLKRVYLPNITQESDAPSLINNNAFPDVATCPDLRFIVSSTGALVIYRQRLPNSWGKLIEGRYQLIDEVTEA